MGHSEKARLAVRALSSESRLLGVSSLRVVVMVI
jgi:hypothetical protein